MLVYHVKNFLDDNLRNDSSTRAGQRRLLRRRRRHGSRSSTTRCSRASPTEGAGFTDAAAHSGSPRPRASAVTRSTTWQGCVDAGRYDDYVDSVETQSFTDGVRGTPTLRIDGKDQELGAMRHPRLFTAAVEAAST